MLIVDTEYRIRQRELSDVTQPVEVRPSDELRERIRATVESWIAGKIEPARIICTGHADPARRETVHKTSTKDPKTNRWRHATRPTPITLEHVMTAKLRRHTDNVDQRVPPFVRLILDDGSKVDLPFTAPAGG
jgi:hypothetical protein